MSNLKWGATSLVTGAALFLLSDTLLGESDASVYAALLGAILFLAGVILALLGATQALIARVRRASS